MVDRGAAERACKDANPIIDGRKANVNLAYLGAKPRSSQTSKCVRSLLNTQDLQGHDRRFYAMFLTSLLCQEYTVSLLKKLWVSGNLTPTGVNIVFVKDCFAHM